MSNTTQKKFSVVHHDNTAKSKELIAKFIRKEKNPHFETPIGDKIADLLMLFHKPKSTLELLGATFNHTAIFPNVKTSAEGYVDARDAPSGPVSPLDNIEESLLDTDTTNIFTVSSPASDTDLQNHLRVLFPATFPVNENLRKDAKLLIENDFFGDFVSRVSAPVSDLATLDNLLNVHASKIDELVALPEFSSGIAKEYLPQAKTWLNNISTQWKNQLTVKKDWHYIERINQILLNSTLTTGVTVERKVLLLSQYIRACFLNNNIITTDTPAVRVPAMIDITKELLAHHLDRELIEVYFNRTGPVDKYQTVKNISDPKILSRYCIEYYNMIVDKWMDLVGKLIAEMAVLTDPDDIDDKQDEIDAKRPESDPLQKEISRFRAIVCIGAIRSLTEHFNAIYPEYDTVAKIADHVFNEGNLDHTQVVYSINPLLKPSTTVPALTAKSFERYIQDFTWKIEEKHRVDNSTARILLLYVLDKSKKYFKGDLTIKSLALVYDFVRLAFQLEEGVFLKTLDESSADMERIIFEMLAGSPVANLFRAFMGNIQFSGIDYTKFNFIPIASGGEIEAEKDVKLSVLLKGSVTVKNTSKKDIRVEILSFEHGVLAREQDKPVIVHAGEKKLVRSD